jgi:hypothetical protein
MMRDRCVAAVQRAAGREMSQKEIQGIEDRISKHMRLLARRDPAGWQKLPEGERMNRAAAAAVDEITREAERQKVRLQLQIAAKDRLERETGNWGGGRMDALKRKIATVTDGKGSFRSIETLAHSIRTDALRRLQEVFDALDPRMLGLFENEEGVTAFTRALYGRTAGVDPKIVQAAKAWLDVAGGMREAFNAAGGKIGKLQDWAMPQHHSQMRVSAAGEAKWIEDTLPKLDRTRYVNEDGTLYDDGQMRRFLQGAWRSIATNGLDDIEPGQQGSAMVANRRAAHREIHFAGPDEFLAYQKQYGDRPLLQIMVNHIDGLARDTAAVEEFGPNPAVMYQYLRDQGLKEAAIADPAHVGRYEAQAVKLDSLWRFVSGEDAPVANQWMARGFDAVRNWLVSTRLGSAVISSIADEGTIAITSKINGMSYMKVFANELRAMNLANGEELRQARRAGLALETMIGDLNRWGQDNLGSTISSKLAHTTLKVSGMNAITDVRRRAFGVTMMDSIGHLTRNVDSLAKLDEHDNRILLSKGITEQDWQVWRLAQPEKWGGNDTVLTPDAIYAIPDEKLAGLVGDLATAGEGGPTLAEAAQKIRREAALRLIGAVAEEVDMAVITPRAIERQFTGATMERGTWKGELTRSVFLFKTTPIAVVYRHWSRALAQESNAGKLGYVAALIASTTLLGAFAMQVKEIIAGRDPRNLNPAEEFGVRNWVQAFLQGGSFGIYGDFLFSGTTRHETSPVAAFLGPVIALAEQMFNLTQGNLVQLAQGKDTNAGAEAVRFFKGNIPMANLWYAKAGLDHAIFNQLQEYVSPGYLNQMRSRMQREFGASFYWNPNDPLPSRAPDLGRVVGN